MKKTTKRTTTREPKLRLETTTVRRLDLDQLERVAGGIFQDGCCASCELTCHG